MGVGTTNKELIYNFSSQWSVGILFKMLKIDMTAVHFENFKVRCNMNKHSNNSFLTLILLNSTLIELKSIKFFWKIFIQKLESHKYDCIEIFIRNNINYLVTVWS